MMKKICLLVLILFSSTLVMAQHPASSTTNGEIAADVVTIKTPQVMVLQSMPGQGEVLMALDNNGVTPHKLIAAYSPVAKQIELHRTVQKMGQTTMRQVNKITLDAKQERDLEADSFHVMLIGIEHTLKKGSKVPITLLFDDGSYINLTAQVD